MAKKKREGDLPEPPKIPSVGELKPTDYLFVGRGKDDLIPIPEDCGFKHPPDNLPNLDIIRKKGRVTGSSIVYDPNSAYNYLSVSERYDKAQTLYPEYLQERENGDLVYGFCSSNSPTGYWEVTISAGGGATFIYFDPPFLTILCPRPFRVSELTTLFTDSTVFQWTQISGSRTVLIIEDDEQDPIIDIQTTCYTGGCDTNTQDPIRIRVETDNPLVFTDLIILNRAIDNWDGGGYAYINSQVTCRKITTIYRVPGYEQKAYIWTCDAINITFLDPTCDTEYITSFRLQQLIPPYTTIDTITINQNRSFSILPNIRYRILVDFDIFGKLETSISDPITGFVCPVANTQQIFADDSCKTLGYISPQSVYVITEFGVQVRFVTDDANSPGYVSLDSTYIIAEFGGTNLNLTDDNHRSNPGYISLQSTYVITDLGGIVIG